MSRVDRVITLMGACFGSMVVATLLIPSQEELHDEGIKMLPINVLIAGVASLPVLACLAFIIPMLTTYSRYNIHGQQRKWGSYAMGKAAKKNVAGGYDEPKVETDPYTVRRKMGKYDQNAFDALRWEFIVNRTLSAERVAAPPEDLTEDDLVVCDLLHTMCLEFRKLNERERHTAIDLFVHVSRPSLLTQDSCMVPMEYRAIGDGYSINSEDLNRGRARRMRMLPRRTRSCFGRVEAKAFSKIQATEGGVTLTEEELWWQRQLLADDKPDDELSCGSMWSDVLTRREWHILHRRLPAAMNKMFAGLQAAATENAGLFEWKDPTYQRIPSKIRCEVRNRMMLSPSFENLLKFEKAKKERAANEAKAARAIARVPMPASGTGTIDVDRDQVRIEDETVPVPSIRTDTTEELQIVLNTPTDVDSSYSAERRDYISIQIEDDDDDDGGGGDDGLYYQENQIVAPFPSARMVVPGMSAMQDAESEIDSDEDLSGSESEESDFEKQAFKGKIVPMSPGAHFYKMTCGKCTVLIAILSCAMLAIYVMIDRGIRHVDKRADVATQYALTLVVFFFGSLTIDGLFVGNLGRGRLSLDKLRLNPWPKVPFSSQFRKCLGILNPFRRSPEDAAELRKKQKKEEVVLVGGKKLRI